MELRPPAHDPDSLFKADALIAMFLTRDRARNYLCQQECSAASRLMLMTWTIEDAPDWRVREPQFQWATSEPPDDFLPNYEVA